MNFFSSKPKSSLSLIIDIQSSVVRGSLILAYPKQPPHIIWTSDVVIPYRADGGSSYLVETMIKAVETVSQSARVFVHDTHAHGTIPGHISHAHCVLSSPWISSQARTVNQQFEKDTKITRAHIHNIIQDERMNLLKSSSDVMMGIEEKIFDVRLNGYSIEKWENNVVRSLEVSFAISVASKRITGSILEAVKRSAAHGSKIDFHSSLLLQHMAMSSSLSIAGSYLLIHVHGELTDIVAVDNQSCVLFGSYPIGVRTIIRQLSLELNLSDSTIDSTLGLYETGQFDPLHASVDVQNIQRALSLWTESSLKITSLIPSNRKPTHAIISSRSHEVLFKNNFSSAYPNIKTDILPSEEILKLATFDPQIEKFRLTVLYAIAIHSLENL